MEPPRTPFTIKSVFTTIVLSPPAEYCTPMNSGGIKTLIILGQMTLSILYLIIQGKREQTPGGRLFLPRLFLLWVGFSLILLLLVAGGIV